MKPGRRSFCALPALCALGVVLSSRSAVAADAETDHVSAEDGPHSIAILANPLAMALGDFGGELDVGLFNSRHFANGALSLEGEYLPLAGGKASAATVGLILFAPKNPMFRGAYLHLRDSFAHVDLASAASVNLVGWAATAGYSWRSDSGFVARLGGGIAEWRTLDSSIDSVGLVVDGNLGWAF